jgi:hypothetical protein
VGELDDQSPMPARVRFNNAFHIAQMQPPSRRKMTRRNVFRLARHLILANPDGTLSNPDWAPRRPVRR